MYLGMERREMANGITRDTFMNLDSDDKLAVLYDYVSAIHSRLGTECPARLEECNARFKQIESKKWWNTAAAGIGGVIGGFVALVAKWILMDPKG